MFIDQILYPVETLGPGRRIAIWLVGCPHACDGCSNPELWEIKGRESVSPKEVFQSIQHIVTDYPVDGFTITGGEPMMQAEELLQLVELLSRINRDILIYSGFYLNEILTDEKKKAVIEKIAVLVDGPYIKELNSGQAMCGSRNQRILLYDLAFERKYEDYLLRYRHRRPVQNFYYPDQAISVGIHDVDFKDALNKELAAGNVVEAE